MSIFTRQFWKDAAERAVRAAAAAEAALLVGSGAGLLDTDWVGGLSVAGMAGVVSLLFSLSAEQVVPNGTASFVSKPHPGDVNPLDAGRAL